MAVEQIGGSMFKDAPRTQAEKDAAKLLRRNRRAAAKYGRVVDATNASNSPDLALSKGKSLDQEYAEDTAAESKQIRKTHDKVWKLTRTCCFCGDTERESAAKSNLWRHEMHEDPSRAKTRGLPPAERFNIYICGRACPACHRLATDNVIVVHFHDEQRRWRGDYDVIVKATGQVLRAMRRGAEPRVRALSANASPERATRDSLGDDL